MKYLTISTTTGGMTSLQGVFDWNFYWGVFGFILQLVAPFVMLVVAIISVGLLIKGVVDAIRSRRG